MRQLSFALTNSPWIVRKDGDATGRDIFSQHYWRRHYADGREPALFVGPGEKLVLITPNADALFVWRKFIDDCAIPQTGINCAVFRNESAQDATQARPRPMFSACRLEARGVDERELAHP